MAKCTKANGDVSGTVRTKKGRRQRIQMGRNKICPKVYSIFACAKECNTDKLMWMDADMVCPKPTDMKRIHEILLPRI